MPEVRQMATLFFDIGGTLASASFVADGSLTFIVLPRVTESLAALGAHRKGIVSNPGGAPGDAERASGALDACGLGTFFLENQLRLWGTKDGPEIFERAASAAGAAANQCVFIGESAEERSFARRAGMGTAPHPVFASAATEGRPALWVRITVPAGRTIADLDAAVRGIEVVPVHAGSETLVLAMATAAGVDDLEQAGFAVERKSPVDETSALLMRDDRPLPSGFVGSPQQEAEDRAQRAFGFISSRVAGFAPAVASLGAGPGGVYVAAPAGTRLNELHIPETGHGHSERLLADPSLLARPGTLHAGFTSGLVAGSPSPGLVEVVRSSITPDVLRGHVSRLSGTLELAPGQAPIRSRHIEHDGNRRVVATLTSTLAALGYSVRRHEFWYENLRIENVEAEHAVPGSDATVLVTAHLDSTAAGSRFTDAQGAPREYVPATDPAPGADDDASGVAAVLAAAACLRRLLDDGKTPTRSIRFVLFNAEEQGLIGSKAYAREAAAAGARIAGVLQMDMIAGLRSGASWRAEIHTGVAAGGPAVVAASSALGALVVTAAAVAAPAITEVETYAHSDPAAGRSDHASFHERGWPAVVMSENFFVGPTEASPAATGTRQYHKDGDTVTDPDHNSDYAAEIARAVTAAALTMAGL
jgi:peptidase M28-like protein